MATPAPAALGGHRPPPAEMINGHASRSAPVSLWLGQAAKAYCLRHKNIRNKKDDCKKCELQAKGGAPWLLPLILGSMQVRGNYPPRPAATQGGGINSNNFVKYLQPFPRFSPGSFRTRRRHWEGSRPAPPWTGPSSLAASVCSGWRAAGVGPPAGSKARVSPGPPPV